MVQGFCDSRFPSMSPNLPVGLFHPRLHAGLSRRLRSLTVAALIGAGPRGHPVSERMLE